MTAKKMLRVNKKIPFTALFLWERWACALHWPYLGFAKLKCYCPLDTSQRAEVVLNNVVPYSCSSSTMYSLNKHHISRCRVLIRA